MYQFIITYEIYEKYWQHIADKISLYHKNNAVGPLIIDNNSVHDFWSDDNILGREFFFVDKNNIDKIDKEIKNLVIDMTILSDEEFEKVLGLVKNMLIQGFGPRAILIICSSIFRNDIYALCLNLFWIEPLHLEFIQYKKSLLKIKCYSFLIKWVRFNLVVKIVINVLKFIKISLKGFRKLIKLSKSV